MNTCNTCNYSLKRCTHSLKKYGNYQAPFECVREDDYRKAWKRSEDSCSQYKRREAGK